MTKNNIWGEAYPDSMEHLIEKSEKNLADLLARLNDPKCMKLDDFYKQNEKNGDLELQKQVVDASGYTFNTVSGKTVKTNNDIQGLYLLGESIGGKVIPQYVGISRAIFRRLKQHGWGKLHNEATLAYWQVDIETPNSGTRTDQEPKHRGAKQEIIRQYKVAILPELLDFDLYFMEVYFAGKLQTPWNTFKTH